MGGRNWSEGEAYRFGHNGQEKSKEVGEDNYTAEFWEYDSQTIRRFNVDPKPNPAISDYATFALNPIWFSDMKGDTTRVFGLDGKYLGILITGSVNEAHFIEESLYKDIKNGHFPNSRDTKKPHKAQENCVRAYSVAYLGKNSMADIIAMKNNKKNHDFNGAEIEAGFSVFISENKELRFNQLDIYGGDNTTLDPNQVRDKMNDKARKGYTNLFGWGHLHLSSDLEKRSEDTKFGNIERLLRFGLPSDPLKTADYEPMLQKRVVDFDGHGTPYTTYPILQSPAFIGTRFGITVYGTKSMKDNNIHRPQEPTDRKTASDGSYIPTTFFK